MAKSTVIALRWVWCACVALVVVAQLAQGQGKWEAELVFFRDGGFFPATITRPPGEFLLVVKNRSRSADQMTLGITHADGTTIVAQENLRTRSRAYLLTLPTGTYLVRDSSHSDWSALTIIIR